MSDYITRDLITLMLKRLPVKSLLRCRCVSKSWKELINSTAFILSHLALQKTLLIVQNQELKYLIIDPDALPLVNTLPGPDDQVRPQLTPRNVRIQSGFHSCYLSVVGSVHGVICLYNNGNFLCLWNPSIRALLRLPVPEFENYDCFRYCRFWIDPKSNEFKIMICSVRIGTAVIFSSKSRSWMEVNMNAAIVSRSFGNEETRQIMIDGVSYWTVLDLEDDASSEEEIVFFDFGRDRFGTISLRDIQPRTVYNRGIFKWKDLLSVLRCEDVSRERCDFWARQNGSWSMMFRFDLDTMVRNVLYVLEDHGRVLGEILPEKDLVLCEPKKESVRLEPEFERPVVAGRGLFAHLAFEFVESLFFQIQNVFRSSSSF